VDHTEIIYYSAYVKTIFVYCQWESWFSMWWS